MAAQYDNLYHIYKLEPGLRNIRLLRIHSRPLGRESSPLRGSLIVRNLDDPTLSFVALSYVWGNTDLSATMNIAEQEIQITASLNSALCHIHPPGFNSGLEIWVDALCINQSDDDEKSAQVALMSEIYRRCTEVLVFLPGPAPTTYSNGPRTSLSEFLSWIASDHFHQIPGYHIDEQTGSVSFSETKEFLASWEGFRLIAESAWWTRSWTAQEIILPPRATFLHAGAESCDYQLLEDVDSNCWHHLFSSRRCCQEAAQIFPKEKMELLQLFLRKLWKIKARRSATTRRLDGRDDFYIVVRHFADRKCTDPRDMIYSLWSQARDDCYRGHILDYSKSLETVFTDISALMLHEASKSLVTTPWCDFRVLYGSGFGPSQRLPGKPSWARDFTHFISTAAFDNSIGRLGCSRLYRASSWNLGTFEVSGRELRLQGYKVDRVALVGQAVWDVKQKKELRTALSQWYGTVEMILTDRNTNQLHVDMARLLCADAYRAKLSPLRWARNATIFAAREAIHVSWHKIRKELAFQKMADSEQWRRALVGDYPQGAAWQSFLRSCDVESTDKCYGDAVEVALTGRAFFMTEGLRLMGLCEPQAKEGDEVWIVDGARLPFVLRPISVPGSGVVLYHLVGDCYVHGCMDGEYATSQQPRENIRIV